MLQKTLFGNQQFAAPVQGGFNQFAAAGGIGTAAGVNTPAVNSSRYDQSLLPGVNGERGAQASTNNLYSSNFRVSPGQETGSVASQHGVDFGPGFPKSFNGAPSVPPGFGDNQPSLFLNA